MKKYDLVTREYDNNGNYVKDDYVVVDGKSFNNIYDIDNYTSSKRLCDIWIDILESGNISGFNSIMIRIVDGQNVSYQDIIINDKVINSCVKDVNYKGEINVNNDLFKKEVKDFFIYLNTYDRKFFKNYLLSANDEFLVLINKYMNSKDDELYKEIISKFSDYLIFRKWILNKDEIKRKGVYDNQCKDYYKNNEFVRKFNTEGGEFIFDDSKEEFLTEEELVDMKVMSKKL